MLSSLVFPGFLKKHCNLWIKILSVKTITNHHQQKEQMQIVDLTPNVVLNRCKCTPEFM